jgi:surface antigen
MLAACGAAPPAPADLQSAAITAPPGPEGFVQCVPYARAVSGIEIYGDAWTWWRGSAGRYGRGEEPRAGAVLAFRRTDRLRLGHLSVVTQVLGPREVLVTHANWGDSAKTRGRIDSDIRVIDVSPGNDWTAVRVWNRRAGAFGSVYPAHGFIYPQPAGQQA